MLTTDVDATRLHHERVSTNEKHDHVSRNSPNQYGDGHSCLMLIAVVSHQTDAL
jgi:hypothetical protein